MSAATALPGAITRDADNSIAVKNDAACLIVHRMFQLLIINLLLKDCLNWAPLNSRSLKYQIIGKQGSRSLVQEQLTFRMQLEYTGRIQVAYRLLQAILHGRCLAKIGH